MKNRYYLLLLFCVICSSQINCEYYYKGDKKCIEACKLAVEAERELIQGSKLSQSIFDEAIKMCPRLDFAYKEKAVPYLKRGDFITWKKLIDIAVEINPEANLGYRGWCKYEFLRDYEGAIEDLVRLKGIKGTDVGYCQSGDYHLDIILALCYKSLGNTGTAIDLIENRISSKNYFPMKYDYLHLGVLYIQNGDSDKAIRFLSKQINDVGYYAETYYYLALVYFNMGESDLYKKNIMKSKDFYENGKMLSNPYGTVMDKIFYSDIIKLIEEGKNE